MTSYTFVANTTNQFVDWTSPAIWSGGIVPNGADADVIFPEVLRSGSPFANFVSIQSGDQIVARSISLTSNFILLNGHLSVANALSVDHGGEIDMQGGTLSVGSLLNAGVDIQGTGLIDSSGTVVNESLIIGSGTGAGLTLSMEVLRNSGTLLSTSMFTVNVADPAASVTNLLGSTLIGGTYAAISGGTLDLNMGGPIVTDAAAIVLGNSLVASAGSNAIAAFDPNGGTYVPLRTSLTTIAPTGILSINRDTFVTSNTLTIQGTASLLGGTLSVAELMIASGGTVDASGSIVGPIENDGIIIADLAHDFIGAGISARLTIQSPVAGGGSLFIAPGRSASKISAAAGATLELAGPASENVRIADATGTLALDAPRDFTGTIVPVGGKGTIVLPGISLSSVTGIAYSGDASGGVLTLTQAGAQAGAQAGNQTDGGISLNFAGSFTAASFTLTAGSPEFSNAPPEVVITALAAPGITPPGAPSVTPPGVPCFAAGSRIATSQGMVPVERLKAGDVALTASGGRQSIQWIGHRRVACGRHPDPERVWPIRIASHAFGNGRPKRALLLSPDHAIFVEGVLIPVKFLVNDSTIAPVKIETVSYYHIELPRHDVLLAEGLPVESYLETGGRAAFENAGTAMQLHADFAPDQARVAMVWGNFACAPLLGDDGQLDRVRMMLRWQSGMLGVTAARRDRRRRHRAAAA